MKTKHLLETRKKYRFREINSIGELRIAYDDLNIALAIAVGKLSYCKGQLTINKRKIKELETQLKKLKER